MNRKTTVVAPLFLRHLASRLMLQRRQPVLGRLVYCASVKHQQQQPQQPSGIKATRDVHDLPGPRVVKSMFNLMRYRGALNLYEVQRKKFETYGPIFKEKFFGANVVHMADADAHKAVVQTEMTFPSRGYDHFADIMEDMPMFSLLGNDHERWKEARSPIAPSFLRPFEIRKFSAGVNSVAQDAVTRFRRQLKNGIISPLKNELDGYAAENICFVIFGERMGFYEVPINPRMQEFMRVSRDFNDAISSWTWALKLGRHFPTPAYKKLTQSKKKLSELSTEFAETRKNRRQRSDDVFLYDKISDKEGKTDFTNGLAIALSQVGVETTSTALQWCLYHLAKNPEVQEKAYQEIVSVIGTTANDKSSHNPQFHSELPYVKACIKESLRFNQIAAAHTRVLENDAVICDYNIPAKTTVILWPWCLASSPKYFKNPEVFDPERWIRGENKETINPFAYLPFGFGVRMCLGRRLAELELNVGLARILQNFHLEYISSNSVNPILKHGLMCPSEEPMLKFIERM